MGALVSLQYLLGMITIIAGSAQLGYIHELNAVLLLAAAIAARHSLRTTHPNAMLPTSLAAAE
jgi:cytochrome c oxidase assembly protein subunit 15